MASHLDLEEQEQLDDLKAFWKQYGNLITWVLVLALGAYAAWNGWNYYLRDQGAKAGSLYDEIDRAAEALDSERATRIFADMKERYPRAVFTQQARPRRRPRRCREGPVRRGAREPRLGRAKRRRGGVPFDRQAAPGRSAARPEALRRSAQAARQHRRRRVRRARQRPARRHPPGARQERRSEGGVPEGLGGDGAEARLPAHRRGQAQRARRLTGRDRRVRRRSDGGVASTKRPAGPGAQALRRSPH